MKSAYWKGGIICFLLIVGAVTWFISSKDSLSVYKRPDNFNLIDQMENVGVPDFTLERLDGAKFQMSSTRGKLVILNFWASWCNPCVEEFPSLIKLVDHFKGDIVLVAISADDEKSDIETFLKAFGSPSAHIHILWDKERAIATKYGVGKLPESFLIGRDGKLIRKVIGIENWFTDGSREYFEHLLSPAKAKAGESPHQ